MIWQTLLITLVSAFAVAGCHWYAAVENRRVLESKQSAEDQMMIVGRYKEMALQGRVENARLRGRVNPPSVLYSYGDPVQIRTSEELYELEEEVESWEAEQLRIYEEQKPKFVITPELRAELDETPEWWDGLFHKALVGSGAVPTYTSEPDEIVEKTASGLVAVHYLSDPINYYDECVCRTCKRGLR